MSRPETVFAALFKLTGLRQHEVARELGVSRSTLAGWLAGYSRMPDEAVLKTHRLICTRLDRVQQREVPSDSAWEEQRLATTQETQQARCRGD